MKFKKELKKPLPQNKKTRLEAGDGVRRARRQRKDRPLPVRDSEIEVARPAPPRRVRLEPEADGATKEEDALVLDRVAVVATRVTRPDGAKGKGVIEWRGAEGRQGRPSSSYNTAAICHCRNGPAVFLRLKRCQHGPKRPLTSP